MTTDVAAVAAAATLLCAFQLDGGNHTHAHTVLSVTTALALAIVWAAEIPVIGEWQNLLAGANKNFDVTQLISWLAG